MLLPAIHSAREAKTFSEDSEFDFGRQTKSLIHVPDVIIMDEPVQSDQGQTASHWNDINIVGFNPQPEPPELADVLFV